MTKMNIEYHIEEMEYNLRKLVTRHDKNRIDHITFAREHKAIRKEINAMRTRLRAYLLKQQKEERDAN